MLARFVKQFLCIVLFCTAFAPAQFSFDMAGTPPSSFYNEDDERLLKNENTYFKVRGAINMPVAFTLDTAHKYFSVWSVGLNGAYTHLGKHGYMDAFPEDFANFTGMISNMRTFIPEYMLISVAGFGFNADIDHINWKSTFWMFGSMVSTQYTKWLNLGAGIFFTNMFGRPLLLPMFMFDIRTRGKWEFVYNMSDIRLAYHFTKQLANSNR